MPDEDDPPRKFYTLKAREFERVNAKPGQPAKTGVIDVRDHLRDAATVARQNPKPAETPAAQNDVQALVQANAAKEHAAGINDTALHRPRRPSRRKRDYVITMAVGNGILLLLLGVFGLNMGTLIFGLAGFILFNLSVTWIMWAIMDDY